jgi:hypothetical protein
MNNLILFLGALVIVFNSFSQTLSMEEIRSKTDSILVEGNMLFKHEKAAWIATDKAMEDTRIKRDFGGFLVYMQNDTINSIIYSRRKSSECIFEMSFLNSFDKPVYESKQKRLITDYERKLMIARDRIIDEIVQNEIPVTVPEGYKLNFVVLPYEDGYKFYIMTGTSKADVIPFGNDYIFFTDNNWKITNWRKFHSRLIPQPTSAPNGEKITSMTHSHLKTEPFISATDICTFMLYGGYYGLNEFSVYSPALSLYFKYFLDGNEIIITERN